MATVILPKRAADKKDSATDSSQRTACSNPRLSAHFEGAIVQELAFSRTKATSRQAQAELVRRRAKKDFRTFFRATLPNKPYVWGRHTLGLLDVLQGVSDRLDAGQSSYTIVMCPPRHGKSDIASRRFPAWRFIHDFTSQMILVSYAGNLARNMSYDVRRCVSQVGPSFGVYVKQDRSAVYDWFVESRARTDAGSEMVLGGGLVAAGLDGAITGRGAQILLIDDPVKNRQDAESERMRDAVWTAFRNDLWTRLAPVHAVIVVLTPWHEDDLVGRIHKCRDPHSDMYDENFPDFKTVRFPAVDEAGGYLFPERFSPSWYDGMRSAVGEYGWNSLFMLDPRPRLGNFLKAQNCKVIDAKDVPVDLALCRSWDLASTAAERAKDDPDFTCGHKLGLRYTQENGMDVPHLFVLDEQRGRWGATERNRRIVEIARQDGEECHVVIEATAGYKDAYEQVSSLLLGLAVVEPVYPNRDKVSRASILEPVLDASHVYLVRGAWNKGLFSELTVFPRGSHDDRVDSLANGYKHLSEMGYIGRL